MREVKVVEKRRPRCVIYMCMVVNVLKSGQFVEKNGVSQRTRNKGDLESLERILTKKVRRESKND